MALLDAGTHDFLVDSLWTDTGRREVAKKSEPLSLREVDQWRCIEDIHLSE